MKKMDAQEAMIRGILQETRDRADCARTAVGAVVIRPNGLVVGLGHNALPTGSCSAGDCPRGRESYADRPAGGSYEDCSAEHAEVAALRRAGRWARGSLLYTTREPCDDCAEAIRQAGITDTVVYLDSTPEDQATEG